MGRVRLAARFCGDDDARVWPLLLLLPLVISRSKSGSSVRTMLIVVVSAACVSSIILLPLRTSIWGFIAIVRHASRGDVVDVSPLMGGNWCFGHSATQAVYFGALLVILGMVYLPAGASLRDSSDGCWQSRC